jgi:hypothetical protein
MKKFVWNNKFKAVIGLCILMLSIFVSSCSDDDDNSGSYPRLRMDFYDIIVDKDSMVSSIILDNGKEYIISNKGQFQSSVCDTTIRCYGSLEISEDSLYAQIYTIANVNCFSPSVAANYNPIVFQKEQFPVELVSIYKARSYINVIVKTKGAGNVEHALDFIKDSMVLCNGHKTLYLKLLHWRPEEEIEAYSTNNYMSLPLGTSFYHPLEDFDSVDITINTYDGIKKYKFAR